MFNRDETEHIMQTLSGSPEKVDVEVKGIRVEKFPMKRIVKGTSKGDPATVEDVLDDDGKPVFEEIEFYDAEIRRGDTPCGTSGRIDDLLKIRHDADPDDYAVNVAKTRALVILSQINVMKGGAVSPLPHGHIPIEQWPAVANQPTLLEIMKYHKVRSVQQLRDMMEAQISRLPAGIQPLRLREMANTFLMQRQGAMADASIEDNAALKQEVNDLRAMLEKLVAGGLAKIEDKAAAATTPAQPAREKLTLGKPAERAA